MPINARVKSGWLRKKRRNPRSLPGDDEPPPPDQELDPLEPDQDPPEDREPEELLECEPL
jgi:hypothetical protein